MDLDDLGSVRTREDLASFVLLLRQDLLVNEAAWENPTLERLLEALAAWCIDMPGHFRNRGVEQPDWNLVARMMMAASTYE